MTESELTAKIEAGQVKEVSAKDPLPSDPVAAIDKIQAWMRDYEPLLEQLRNGIADDPIPPPTSNVVACRIYQTSPGSIPNNTLTAMTFDIAEFDTDAFFDAGDPDSLTAPEDGLYAIHGVVTFQSSATGQRAIYITVNSTEVQWTNDAGFTASFDFTVQISRIVQLTAGDIVRMVAYQNSGGSLGTNPGLAYTSLSIHKIN